MMECRKAFCAGMLTSRALIFTSSTSCSSISSRSSGSITHPRLLKLCRCDPATAMYTLLIITSLFCSASTTASCTHFIAVSKSTISPLRAPRDGEIVDFERDRKSTPLNSRHTVTSYAVFYLKKKKTSLPDKPDATNAYDSKKEG